MIAVAATVAISVPAQATHSCFAQADTPFVTEILVTPAGGRIQSITEVARIMCSAPVTVVMITPALESRPKDTAAPYSKQAGSTLSKTNTDTLEWWVTTGCGNVEMQWRGSAVAKWANYVDGAGGVDDDVSGSIASDCVSLPSDITE